MDNAKENKKKLLTNLEEQKIENAENIKGGGGPGGFSPNNNSNNEEGKGGEWSRGRKNKIWRLNPNNHQDS